MEEGRKRVGSFRSAVERKGGGGRDAEEEEGSRDSAQEKKTRSEVVDHSGALEFNRGRRLGKEKGGRGWESRRCRAVRVGLVAGVDRERVSRNLQGCICSSKAVHRAFQAMPLCMCMCTEQE